MAHKEKEIDEKNAMNNSANQSADAMDQVRDLLFGQAQKSNDERIEQLFSKIDQVSDNFNERLDQLDQKIELLTLQLDSEHKENIQQIGEGLSALGKDICKALNVKNIND